MVTLNINNKVVGSLVILILLMGTICGIYFYGESNYNTGYEIGYVTKGNEIEAEQELSARNCEDIKVKIIEGNQTMYVKYMSKAQGCYLTNGQVDSNRILQRFVG